MQLATIQETKLAARAKYAEYLQAVKKRHSAEYVALKNAYRELSRGRQVIDIVEVMRNAGADQHGRPRLAICEASERLCWFDYDGPFPRFRSDKTRSVYQARGRAIKLPADTFAPWRNVEDRHRFSCRAVVPSIPPSLLPAGDLDKYHILWEAEWERMPVDPLLLRHLGRNLYVVLAQWDLTPLERAVLQPLPQ